MDRGLRHPAADLAGDEEAADGASRARERPARVRSQRVPGGGAPDRGRRAAALRSRSDGSRNQPAGPARGPRGAGRHFPAAWRLAPSRELRRQRGRVRGAAVERRRLRPLGPDAAAGERHGRGGRFWERSSATPPGSWRRGGRCGPRPSTRAAGSRTSRWSPGRGASPTSSWGSPGRGATTMAMLEAAVGEGYDVAIQDRTTTTCLVGIAGPLAAEAAAQHVNEGLPPRLPSMHASPFEFHGYRALAIRTSRRRRGRFRVHGRPARGGTPAGTAAGVGGGAGGRWGAGESRASRRACLLSRRTWRRDSRRPRRD